MWEALGPDGGRGAESLATDSTGEAWEEWFRSGEPPCDTGERGRSGGGRERRAAGGCSKRVEGGDAQRCLVLHKGRRETQTFVS